MNEGEIKTVSGLQCLPQLKREWQECGRELYPYQVESVERAVNEMGGRAILADEVGLGKTIEAGLCLREWIHRGECEQVLILVPASLVLQWARELQEKFGLTFTANPRGQEWLTSNRIVASIDLAKRDTQRHLLDQRTFDVVIIDEAHRLKNRATKNYQLVQELNSRYLLLLSATPLQNDLHELYNLVSLVRPEVFGSRHAFERRFMLSRRIPKDAPKLKALLESVMIRNRRGDMSVPLPARKVALLPLKLNPAEQTLYDAVTELVRSQYWERLISRMTILPLLTLQREVCSSPKALLRTLEGVGGDWLDEERQRLIELCHQVEKPTKAETLEGLIQSLDEKVIVFTEFRATQEDLVERLRGLGRHVVEFHGGMSSEQRDRSLGLFAGPADVLVSTESGGQGLNLQFCRKIVNYDLPWNPMRVEQRIGRVHRIGQTDEVHIYNLASEGTIEEHILRLLDEKINLFRAVIGELDVIIRTFQKKRSLEARILQIAATAKDRGDMEAQFSALGEQLLGFARRAEWQEAYGSLE